MPNIDDFCQALHVSTHIGSIAAVTWRQSVCVFNIWYMCTQAHTHVGFLSENQEKNTVFGGVA